MARAARRVGRRAATTPSRTLPGAASSCLDRPHSEITATPHRLSCSLSTLPIPSTQHTASLRPSKHSCRRSSGGARARGGRGQLRRHHAPRRITAKGARVLPGRRRGRPVSCCKQRGSCTYERWLQGGATARLVVAAVAAAGAGNCATSLPHSRASVALLTHDIRSRRPVLSRPMPAWRPPPHPSPHAHETRPRHPPRSGKDPSSPHPRHPEQHPCTSHPSKSPPPPGASPADMDSRLPPHPQFRLLPPTPSLAIKPPSTASQTAFSTPPARIPSMRNIPWQEHSYTHYLNPSPSMRVHIPMYT